MQFVCEYTANSPIGEYAIVPSGLTSDNYEIQFVKWYTLCKTLRTVIFPVALAVPVHPVILWIRNHIQWRNLGQAGKGWRFDYKMVLTQQERTKDADGTIYENLKWGEDQWKLVAIWSRWIFEDRMGIRWNR